MSPPTRYDAIADFYVATVGDDISDPATGALLDLAGEVNGCRVLDIACGHGRVARELARQGAQVVGVDISTALLAKAKAVETHAPLGITYQWADVTSSRCLAGEAFDLVVCNFGLSDIDDLSDALATVARVLKPGGVSSFSILHQCFPGSGEDAPSSWPPEGYFHEGWWLAANRGFRGSVGSNFRMVSTYLNTLVRHGLAFDRMREPPPSHKHSGTPLGAPLPWFLVIRAHSVLEGAGTRAAPLKRMATEKQREAA